MRSFRTSSPPRLLLARVPATRVAQLVGHARHLDASLQGVLCAAALAASAAHQGPYPITALPKASTAEGQRAASRVRTT